MPKPTLDMSELFRLGENIKNKQLREDFIRYALKDATKNHIARLKRRTPVKTGRLKNSWDWNNQNIIVDKVGDFYSVTLYNGAKNPKDGSYYASYVEKGHRKVVFGRDTGGWVVGRFFVKASEMETSTNISKDIEPYINNWWERLHYAK